MSKQEITDRERRRLKVSQHHQNVLGTPDTETNHTYQKIVEAVQYAQQQRKQVTTVDEEDESPTKTLDSKVHTELDEKAKLKEPET